MALGRGLPRGAIAATFSEPISMRVRAHGEVTLTLANDMRGGPALDGAADVFEETAAEDLVLSTIMKKAKLAAAGACEPKV